jgi:ribonuclease P protein component
MISKAHRFNGHGSLKYTYRNGETIRGPLCSLKFVVNNRRKDYRLAVVVNKKVHKSAVVRNRIRRIIYEIVRTNAEQIKVPYDIVITIFSDQILEISPEEQKTMVTAQLHQAGII